MRVILSILSLGVAGSASLVTHAPGVAHGFSHALAVVSAALPDPSTAALLFGGLGLIVGARRGAVERAEAER